MMHHKLAHGAWVFVGKVKRIGLGALAQSLCEGADSGRIYNDNG
jgi:hypothetical protein